MTLSSPEKNTLIPVRIQQLLNRMFAGESGFSGPQIIEFFSKYSDAIEPYSWGSGMPSRWQILEDCLAKFDLERQRKIISDLLDYEGYTKYPRPSGEDVEQIREWLGEGPTPITKEALKTVSINWTYVNQSWAKAAARVKSDPAGAITSARTLLESVCMHILDELGQTYPRDGDLQRLYKITAKALTLSPDQQTEDVFRHVLGGCASIANALAGMRNSFGDAHGQGQSDVEAEIRHARLAVNAAGTLALFLIETHLASKS